MSLRALAESLIRLDSEGERIVHRGIDIIVKSPAPGSSQGWTVLDYSIPPRLAGAPLHYHEHLIESFYVASGSLWIKVGDREVSAGPGSFVLVNPGTPHAFANQTDSPARFVLHASSPAHRDFLFELFELVKGETVWPPKCHPALCELSERYDTYYL